MRAIHPNLGGVPMIQVSEKNFIQVEYLLNQSIQGNHILFDAEQIRKAFLNRVLPAKDEEYVQVKSLIEKLIALDSIEEQKNWIKSLNEKMLTILVKTYLNIVENRIFDEGIRRH